MVKFDSKFLSEFRSTNDPNLNRLSENPKLEPQVRTPQVEPLTKSVFV